MHTLPKRALAVACAAALLGTGTSALAAESVPASAPSTGISVQLDGRNLSFPDAAPEARDGRTFLPVRTVFEAMGAEVSYSPAAQTITAVRDGTTVTMALGGTTATVERSGVTTHIPMDAAPYAHDNRTYVPVRFAAQAFGCAVGWDAGDRTVILIDMEKLVEETLSKYDFTYLEKYLAYGQKYRTGIWDMNADFDASLDMTGLLLGSTAESAPITLDGTLEGVMAGGAKMDAAMGLTIGPAPLPEGSDGWPERRYECQRYRVVGCPCRGRYPYGAPGRSGGRTALYQPGRSIFGAGRRPARRHLVLYGYECHI